MNAYHDSHWVTDPAITMNDSLHIVEKVIGDIKEAKSVLGVLGALFGGEGTGEKTVEIARTIMEGVFEDRAEGNHYTKAQARSAYSVAVSAQMLADFMLRAATTMVDDIDANGEASS